MESTVFSKGWDGPRTVEMEEGATVQHMLDRFGFLAHAVVLHALETYSHGEPVPENVPVEEGASYEVIPVASGG